MNFKELNSFVAICKYKNFSKAADHLFLTQPTISTHIQLLEEELNTTLFKRNAKTVELTDSAKILLVYAKKILSEIESIKHHFVNYNKELNGELYIASSTIPTQYFLPDMLKEFSFLHPTIQFNIRKMDSFKVHKLLAENRIDFGIVGSKLNPNFFYEKIFSDEIVLCADYNVDSKEIRIEDIKELPLIVREDGSGTKNVLLDYLKTHNMEEKDLKIFATMDDINTIKSCIIGTDKMTFTSDISIKDEIEKKILKIIPIKDFKINRNFYFVYNKDHILSPLSLAFKKFIERIKK